MSAAGLVGAYTSLGSYPDEHLGRLVGAASEALHIPAQDVIRWFGREAMPALAQAYPAFFSPHTGTRSFLLTLNDIIHPEVRKIYPGADVPEFDFEQMPDGNLRMGYDSHRKLCSNAGPGDRVPICVARGPERVQFTRAATAR